MTDTKAPPRNVWLNEPFWRHLHKKVRENFAALPQMRVDPYWLCRCGFARTAATTCPLCGEAAPK